MSHVKPMPPSTCTAARALSIGRLAGEELGGARRPRRRRRPRVVEDRGRRVGRAAGQADADEHVGQQVLERLERADGHAELLALEGVVAGDVERGLRRRRAASPRSSTVPEAPQPVGRRRVADLRPRRQRSRTADRRERVERVERPSRRAGSPRSTRTRRPARSTSERVDSAACSTRIGSSVTRDRVEPADDALAPSVSRRRRAARPSADHRTGRATRWAPSCSNTMAASTTEAERRRRPRRPAGRSTPRSASSAHVDRIGRRRRSRRRRRSSGEAGRAERRRRRPAAPADRRRGGSPSAVPACLKFAGNI